jgi:hypothetical protein
MEKRESGVCMQRVCIGAQLLKRLLDWRDAQGWHDDGRINLHAGYGRGPL